MEKMAVASRDDLSAGFCRSTGLATNSSAQKGKGTKTSFDKLARGEEGVHRNKDSWVSPFIALLA